MKYLGLDLVIYPSVYEPAEDSFLLANAAMKLRGKILEIGCGSGIVSLICAREGGNVLGVDVNPEAVKCAKINAKRNKIKSVQFIESDLFSNVPKQQFDAILFNPPYLPTSREEVIEGDLNLAFDGGPDGLSVIKQFLNHVDSYLKPGGVLLIILSSLTNEKAIIRKLQEMGYKINFIAQEKFFFEKLYLTKATKP
ncbi:putative S-adenosylmethionine-dependent methyltransferase [Candidatus Bilamarchaeum dharawalense]|uniref:Putative S-adenosylmethionine-dependent methyltransferase n=1 Tax=Candidatus Bilamarchaeum dharawalense TaxID=2885759 RepID=A0A5E4LTA0_9ARCH|nr:putative S-adenosylmethionine-dependent methyltransferase [Candidatus Bilamarchaeum dharawalense]